MTKAGTVWILEFYNDTDCVWKVAYDGAFDSKVDVDRKIKELKSRDLEEGYTYNGRHSWNKYRAAKYTRAE